MIGSSKLTPYRIAQGVSAFPSVLPWHVRRCSANLSGFAASKVRDVEVGLGVDQVRRIRLRTRGRVGAVTVTAESPIVDVKQSDEVDEYQRGTVDLVPHNRDFTSMVIAGAGRNNESKSGGI